MNVERFSGDALLQGRFLVATLEVNVGNMCVVDVTIPGVVVARGLGGDMFGGLVEVRRHLEDCGILLHCNGSRINVYPSPMLRQASAGRFAYELSLPRSSERPRVVDIFAKALNPTDIVTVDVQRQWFERWSWGEATRA